MVYQMGRKPSVIYDQGLLNDAELRIMQLRTLLNDGIKPWEYDYERYSDENEFMKGMFYQEDWANLRAIENMIADKEGAAEARSKTQAAAQK
jgi:hypothetical protein